MIGIKKRFQVAKCKTSLKLATARIKLMRNKKGAQVIQMKKELAQLLASGDDRTARIRVEHVIREEKMIGAYDLIEMYCELIVARLPIIESQKTCPMDLKEAIASVIFATPRCSDITELVDVKKNFRAKYGKEFVTAATELIPDCGVSRMLVEKLSAVAPNIQTKVKVLSDIAKEHNVHWEATSFEEVKPRDDVLATPITIDPPKVQTTPDVPADFFQLNKKFTSDAQKNVTPADTSSQQSSYASTSHNDARPTCMTSGSMKKNQSLRTNSNNSNHSSDRDNDMEFKDATSAAHAAAEAAERASYAARAAAKLAREGSFTKQSPTKSHESHIRDEMSYNGSFNDRKSRNESTSSGSRSRNDSDESSVSYDNHRKHKVQGSSRSNKESEARFKRRDSGYDETDYEDNTKKVGRKTVVDQETVVKNTKKTSSFSGARRDDESESDDDDYDGPRFDDTGFDPKTFFPSPDKEEEDSHVWSSIKNKSNSKDRVKPAKSVDYSVKSHLSDGPDSESESGSYKFDSPRKQDFSKKPVEESQSPVKVTQASSFNARPSRVEKKKLTVRKTSSDSDSDDNDDKFPQKPSRSPFARPNTFFSNGNDSDEQVYTPTSKAHLSPHGVSRRTKGQVEPKAKQSRAEPAEDFKTRPTSTISPPKPRPHAARPKQEPPKRVPEPKVSTPPAEVDNVKKPSHVHPKLPDFEDLAERIYAINKMERK